MAIIFRDRAIDNQHDVKHPALYIDEEHPCYRMVRERIGDKIVFHWDSEQALRMYKWYCTGYRRTDIYDEFDTEIYSSNFERWVKISYYMVPAGKKMVPSEETIEDLWKIHEMERKLMEANGDE